MRCYNCLVYHGVWGFTDLAESMSLQYFASWLLFKSSFVRRLYLYTISSRSHCIRTAGLTFISVVFLLRSARQFMVPKLMASTLSLVAMCALQSLMTLVLLILSIVLILAWRINLQAGDGIGHRAGWEGFEGMFVCFCWYRFCSPFIFPLVCTGEYCENTIEGMRALVALDNGEGVTEHFPFLEFDVQETQDGQVWLLLDSTYSYIQAQSMSIYLLWLLISFHIQPQSHKLMALTVWSVACGFSWCMFNPSLPSYERKYSYNT